jgi:plastocyanin
MVDGAATTQLNGEIHETELRGFGSGGRCSLRHGAAGNCRSDNHEDRVRRRAAGCHQGHLKIRRSGQCVVPDARDDHAGDAVKFVTNGFHTVDLPDATGQPIPLILPGSAVAGVKDAAGNPFWFNGKVPNVNLNPALLAPTGTNGTTYDGTTRVDSGLPAGPAAPLNVTFTKPGTYKYFCDVHYGMVGEVVKPTGAPIPSDAQDAAALKQQIKTDLNAAKKLASTKVPANQLSLGISNNSGVELFNIYPGRLKVKRGTVVRFFMSADTRETHTATFGPKKVIAALEKAFTSPKFPAQGVYPSSPTQPILLSPTSHGDGFGGTGAMDRDSGTPQVPASGRIKFTKPGVYKFVCLIHPNMHGTIIVTR